MKKWIFSLFLFIVTVAVAIGFQAQFPIFKEAILTAMGALIALGGTWFFNSRDTEKAARYLAIRLVCVFDTYIEDCVSFVTDDGLSYGSRNQDGYLEPQVASPGQPEYPDDVDWKSISHELMYEILSFPSDVEAADKAIGFAWDDLSPPDYDQGFEEQSFHYAQIGLKAYDLAQKLRGKYQIPEKDYTDWNPVLVLKKELEKIKKRQNQRAEANQKRIGDMQKEVA